MFKQIVTELANQYVLSYSSTALKQDGKWRNIKFRVARGNYDVKARRGILRKRPAASGEEKSMLTRKTIAVATAALFLSSGAPGRADQPARDAGVPAW